MNLRIYFKIAKEVEMAMDEKGNLQEAFACVKLENTNDKVRGMIKAGRKALAATLDCNEKFITHITLDEYLDSIEKGDKVQLELELSR